MELNVPDSSLAKPNDTITIISTIIIGDLGGEISVKKQSAKKKKN